jgi:hypothetical protein
MILENRLLVSRCIATTPEVTIHADGEEMVFGGPG